MRRRAESDSHSSADDLIDQIVADIRAGGSTAPPTPPPDPPTALVFHQVSGAAASRYITIVLG